MFVDCTEWTLPLSNTRFCGYVKKITNADELICLSGFTWLWKWIQSLCLREEVPPCDYGLELRVYLNLLLVFTVSENQKFNFSFDIVWLYAELVHASLLVWWSLAHEKALLHLNACYHFGLGGWGEVNQKPALYSLQIESISLTLFTLLKTW